MDYNLVLDMLTGEPQRTFDEFERLQKKGQAATYEEWFEFENGLDCLLTEFKWKDEEKQKRLDTILATAKKELARLSESDLPDQDD